MTSGSEKIELSKNEFLFDLFAGSGGLPVGFILPAYNAIFTGVPGVL
jgi:hypothetical protein